jgi:hypothetical protein
MNKYVPTATALRLNESIALGWNEPLHRADSFLGREQCPGPCDGGPGVLLSIHSLLVAKVPSAGAGQWPSERPYRDADPSRLFISSCLRTPGLASACRRLYLTCRPCDLQLPIENSSASPKHLKFVTEKLPHAAIDHGVSQMSCS